MFCYNTCTSYHSYRCLNALIGVSNGLAFGQLLLRRLFPQLLFLLLVDTGTGGQLAARWRRRRRRKCGRARVQRLRLHLGRASQQCGRRRITFNARPKRVHHSDLSTDTKRETKTLRQLVVCISGGQWRGRGFEWRQTWHTIREDTPQTSYNYTPPANLVISIGMALPMVRLGRAWCLALCGIHQHYQHCQFVFLEYCLICLRKSFPCSNGFNWTELGMSQSRINLQCSRWVIGKCNKIIWKVAAARGLY